MSDNPHTHNKETKLAPDVGDPFVQNEEIHLNRQGGTVTHLIRIQGGTVATRCPAHEPGDLKEAVHHPEWAVLDAEDGLRAHELRHHAPRERVHRRLHEFNLAQRAPLAQPLLKVCILAVLIEELRRGDAAGLPPGADPVVQLRASKGVNEVDEQRVVAVLEAE